MRGGGWFWPNEFRHAVYARNYTSFLIPGTVITHISVVLGFFAGFAVDNRTTINTGDVPAFVYSKYPTADSVRHFRKCLLNDHDDGFFLSSWFPISSD